MKNLIILCSLVFSSFLSFSQNAYYDAIKLRQHIDSAGNSFDGNKTTLEQVAVLLKPYLNDSKVTASTGKLLANLSVSNSPNYNPFIGPYVDITGTQGASLTGSVSSTPKLSLSSIGSTDVTKYAEGLAQFMIERSQAELTVAFFNRFKKFTTDHPDIKTLFPKSCERLESILTINYQQMLNVLREAFQEDLNNLPEHLEEVLEQYGKDHKIPELTLAVRTLRLVRNLDNSTASEFIGQLPELTSDSDTTKPMWYQNLNASLELTAIFSNSIQDTTTNVNWVSAKEFSRNILGDQITKDIFLGLIYLQIQDKNIAFNGHLILAEIAPEKITWFNDELSNFFNLIQKTEKIITEIKRVKGNTDGVASSYVRSCLSLTLEVTNFGIGISKHFDTAKLIDDTKFAEYLKWIESGINIYEYTDKKLYGSAIMESAKLLKTIYEEIKPTQTKSINGLVASVDQGQVKFQFLNNTASYQTGSNLNQHQVRIMDLKMKRVTEILKLKKSSGSKDVENELKNQLEEELKQFEKDHAWVDKFVTYGVFMANMVKAESAGDVSAIIESVALPVGSSTLRKQSKFSINLTSYLGASMDLDATRSGALTAPIGVDFGVGFGKAGSLSLNFTVLDVGAIVDYQLSADSSSIVSKITLGNILSPGAYVVYGFPYRLPLAIGVGGQYGPGLNSVSADGVSVVNAPTWKFRAFIAVDMPLMNFYNTPRTKL